MSPRASSAAAWAAPRSLGAEWTQSTVCTPDYGGWKRVTSPSGDKHRMWLGEVIRLGLIKKRNLPKGSGSRKVACDWLPATVGNHKYNHLGSDLTTRHTLRTGVLLALTAQHFCCGITYTAKTDAATSFSAGIHQPTMQKPEHQVTVTSPKNCVSVQSCLKRIAHTSAAQTAGSRLGGTELPVSRWFRDVPGQLWPCSSHGSKLCSSVSLWCTPKGP